jgi:hypothetical protein
MKLLKRTFLMSAVLFSAWASAQNMNAGAVFNYQGGGGQAYGGVPYAGGGGYPMPPGSLAAVNPGAAQYAHSVGPGEQPAYYQGSPGVNCVPRGYSSPIEGPISNGAPVVVGGGGAHQ